MKAPLKYLASITIITVCVSGYSAAQDPNIERLRTAGDAAAFPGADVAVVYDSTDVDVQPTGLSYVTMHKLVKILTVAGALENRAVVYGYDPLSAAVDVRLVRIYRAGGSVETLPSDRIHDYPAPARAIYWGAREKAVDIGRLEPGDAIETIAFRKGFTYALLADPGEDDKFIPPMKGHYYDIVEFWSSVPVKEKVYRLFLPETMKLQYEVYNGELASYIHRHPEKNTRYTVDVNPQMKMLPADPAKLHPTQGMVTKPGKLTYCWYKRDIMPLKRERDMVDPSDIAPKLLLSTSPDWYAKAVWFNGVNEDYQSFAVTPEVKSKVDELLKGVTGEVEKISILTHWVAEYIRYSGISMGEGEGYTLHTGKMTFADRCGVCKDKAGMLITMLRAAGFESYPAMTMAGSRIDRIPADQFNHSVTVVKRANGNWMLLDPTWVPGVRELWSSAEQQQNYLMGIPGGSDLMETPVSPAENHYFKLDGKSLLKRDGTLEGEFTLEAEGQSDATIRRMYQRSFRSAMDEVIPGLLYNVSPYAQVLESRITEPYDISEPFKMKVKYRIPGYAESGGKRMYALPLLARDIFPHTFFMPELDIDTSIAVRNYGFRTRSSRMTEIRDEMRFDFPLKNDIAVAADPVKTPAVSFNSSLKTEGGAVKYQLQHTLEKRVYDKEDWNDFRNALQYRMRINTYPIVLEPK